MASSMPTPYDRLKEAFGTHGAITISEYVGSVIERELTSQAASTLADPDVKDKSAAGKWLRRWQLRRR